MSAETIEQEHHWLNYEYEEAQVKIDLSDMILEHLVEELATLMNNMHKKDQPESTEFKVSKKEEMKALFQDK